ncbi:hypothetical protein CYMTET_24907 [Cymbomonas tetramitiformis]|uniref:Ribosome-recycling factor, chloroplastic n=1 Tax=Cymbomonas tetramitiformis TaxID=36881 RepID=A0AAE0FVG8_9CHLO|nr:hypothetical protein CYMTET_24907 [Cymbomonas tetramitiformis]
MQQKHAVAGISFKVQQITRLRFARPSSSLSIRMEDGEEEMMIEETAMDKMEKTLGNVQENLVTIRTGRANPAILDRVEVEYYGAPCPLKQLASVNTPDSSTITVSPFDKSILGDIERALMQSDVGITPSNDGNIIRLAVPMLTQERRVELTKTVNKLGEEGKVALRNVRRDANKELSKLEKDGTSSKDTVAEYNKVIDDLTSSYVKKIEAIVKSKEEEILKV